MATIKDDESFKEEYPCPVCGSDVYTAPRDGIAYCAGHGCDWNDEEDINYD